MTLEELKAKLEAKGINVGEWVPAGDGEVSAIPPSNVQELASRLSDLLEAQISEDTALLEKAKAKLSLIKHGGNV